MAGNDRRYITLFGEEQTVKFWATNYSPKGVGPKLILQRIKNEWSDYDAVMTPKCHVGETRVGFSNTLRVTFEGVEYTYNELAIVTGWAANTLRRQVQDGREIGRKTDIMEARKKDRIVRSYTRGRWDNPLPHQLSPEEFYIFNLRESGLSDSDIIKRFSNG